MQEEDGERTLAVAAELKAAAAAEAAAEELKAFMNNAPTSRSLASSPAAAAGGGSPAIGRRSPQPSRSPPPAIPEAVKAAVVGLAQQVALQQVR